MGNGIQSGGGAALCGLIIAGGSGTRLWPLSRAESPKQLHALDGGERSLLQQTFERLSRAISPRRIKTVTSEKHREQVLRQIRALQPDYPEGNLLCEPVGRDSAPAILWGALTLAREEPGAVAVVVWCDQHIGSEEAFDRAIARAVEVARGGALALIAITPTRPDPGLGYIKYGAAAGEGVYQVERFLEKPDRETAGRLIAEGGYGWNAGLFVFNVGTLLEEFERLGPEIWAAFAPLRAGSPPGGAEGARVVRQVYDQLRPAPFDTLLLEKTGRLLAIPCDLAWSDLGAWEVLYREAAKDGDGNAISGNVVTLASRNSLIRGQRRLIATVGVSDLVVIDTDDALLICDMAQTQQVKALVEQLAKEGRPEASTSATTHRPWGLFTILQRGEGFLVKLIEVLPGQKLSLQLHRHRSEHWVVIEGRAEMICEEENRAVGPGESFYIPRGKKHCVANSGDAPLRFIELQFGDYLEEDDIVRFEDRYGRV